MSNPFLPDMLASADRHQALCAVEPEDYTPEFYELRWFAWIKGQDEWAKQDAKRVDPVDPLTERIVREFDEAGGVDAFYFDMPAPNFYLRGYSNE